MMPEPIVDSADVAFVFLCDIGSTPTPQYVQESKALRCEDVAVLHATRSHLRPRSMQPIVNSSRAYTDSHRNLLDPHTCIIQVSHIYPRKREPMSVLLPTPSFLPSPSEDGHAVRRLQAFCPHVFRDGTTRKSGVVQPERPSPHLCRVPRFCRIYHGQPVHGSVANSLTEQ